MARELLLWFLAFAAAIVLFARTTFQLINLTGSEFDYVNPFESSSHINAVVVPELMVQGTLSVLFLLNWHWFPFLIMAPITCYHIKLYKEGKHLIDVTEVFRLLNKEKKYRLVKLAFYCSVFFIVIYRLIGTASVLFIEEGGNQLYLPAEMHSD